MKPWREIAIPHEDVLKGTMQQADFAADISAVHAGKAPAEYQNAKSFFDRTYITEGMRLLLTQVAQRLSGRGGEPVIQLQTAFGGGKTHTMLAVMHLASRKCQLSELQGIPSLVEKAGITDVPEAHIVVLDGTAHSPGQAWKHGKTTINTLWGELAWQLGGEEGLALVKEADSNGTSPGKDVLKRLLEAYAPCVILMDELVAYIRQFVDKAPLSGGTFGSNISFIQALTEAAKLVPTSIILASLPESDPKRDQRSVQIGGEEGLKALRELESVVGRVQAIWRPVATEEAFEIVRRRLFKSIEDLKARDVVCRAFVDAYKEEGARLPSETQEARYYDRLIQAYPIHPEVFDRLYEDWTTIEGFQRTRGVLKLMAKVIGRLWTADNKDHMILPGSLPLSDSDVRSELSALLPAGWEPVIEADIDGERAETTELEKNEPRFGQVNAAKRVARTLFLGSAPSSVVQGTNIRGLDRGRVLLGCLQPGQSTATYSDALSRLADRLHYLNSSGDKAADATRYWFDTRANLRREMEDRKSRYTHKPEVTAKIEAVTKKLFGNTGVFEGVHVFTGHSDIPDDTALRLVVLTQEQSYLKDDPKIANTTVLDYIRCHGNQPRHRANRLMFIAPDMVVLNRLKDAVQTALAWQSIVDDVEEGRLNIDQIQRKQAEKEAEGANGILPRIARECFKWLLCPTQDDPTAKVITVEAFQLNTSSGTPSSELERVCKENELVIDVWSPIHLRTKLKELYWKGQRAMVSAATFWEDSLRYVYLPRFKSRDVLNLAISSGAASDEFFGTAYGQSGAKYEGFKLGDAIPSVDGTLLLIEPGAAKKYALEHTPTISSLPVSGDEEQASKSKSELKIGGVGAVPATSSAQPKAFHGSVDVSATLAKSKLNSIAEEVISLLTQDPNAVVKVTVEISAEFPNGASDSIKRSVSENTSNLGFKVRGWE
jgi:predicted AAA+ superfamily ATPase